MTNTITSAPFLQRETSWQHADDVEHIRGRTRDRTLSRATVGKSVRPDESSTLRGRSRQRATSPSGRASRNASPSLGSILYYRLKGSSRREHCPSRPASSSSTRRRQNSPRRRQQRARSRSRTAARAAVESMMLENQQQQQQTSSLRNEILIQDKAGNLTSFLGDPQAGIRYS